MSSTRPSTLTTTLTSADQARRFTVVAAEIFCVVGTLFGVGVLGTRVEESSGGALAADATLLAPAGPAFSIWTVIYLGLAGYTVWQFLPRNATSERTRATGWLAAVSMVLNAAWLLVTQQGWIWVSVVVIAALVVTLGLLVARLAEPRPSAGREGMLETVLVDGTFGAYLGWVTVATCANVTAALVDSGVDLGAEANELVAVVVVLVALGVGVLLAWRLGGRWAVAAAMAWGLAWITVGRLTDEPRSTLTGLTAALAAVGVLVAAGWFGRADRGTAPTAGGAGSRGPVR